MAQSKRIAAILISVLLLVSVLAGVITIWRGSTAFAGDRICSAANEPVSDSEDNGIERAQQADR
jgi:flagellar basal body-associated protein FliL